MDEKTQTVLTMLEESVDIGVQVDVGELRFMNDPWVVDPPPHPWLAWQSHKKVPELFCLLCEDYVDDVDYMSADGKKLVEDYQGKHGKQNEVTNLFKHYKNLKQAFQDSDVRRLLKVRRMELHPDSPMVREWKRDALLREQREREGGGEQRPTPASTQWAASTGAGSASSSTAATAPTEVV